MGKKDETPEAIDADILPMRRLSGHTENPPISAKKAISLAEKPKKLLAENREGFEWRLEQLTLSRLEPLEDCWYWTVSYRALPDNPDGDFTKPHFIMVVILMDGTVIAPMEAKDSDEPEENQISK